MHFKRFPLFIRFCGSFYVMGFENLHGFLPERTGNGAIIQGFSCSLCQASDSLKDWSPPCRLSVCRASRSVHIQPRVPLSSMVGKLKFGAIWFTCSGQGMDKQTTAQPTSNICHGHFEGEIEERECFSSLSLYPKASPLPLSTGSLKGSEAQKMA